MAMALADLPAPSSPLRSQVSGAKSCRHEEAAGGRAQPGQVNILIKGFSRVRKLYSHKTEYWSMELEAPFKHKPFDARTVMGFGVLNGILIGLLNQSLGFNSVGFYQIYRVLGWLGRLDKRHSLFIFQGGDESGCETGEAAIGGVGAMDTALVLIKVHYSLFQSHDKQQQQQHHGLPPPTLSRFPLFASMTTSHLCWFKVGLELQRPATGTTLTAKGRSFPTAHSQKRSCAHQGPFHLSNLCVKSVWF
uniref:Uncharacterized protein n=1 Tax=Aegilops tauschii TaxID=37682 RepID=M8BTU6_AEGTA